MDEFYEGSSLAGNIVPNFQLSYISVTTDNLGTMKQIKSATVIIQNKEHRHLWNKRSIRWKEIDLFVVPLERELSLP